MGEVRTNKTEIIMWKLDQPIVGFDYRNFISSYVSYVVLPSCKPNDRILAWWFGDASDENLSSF
jgi:hypothetical protein